MDLLLSNWSKVYDDGQDVNMWRAFLEIWCPVIEKPMPLVTIKVRHPPCRWLEKDPEVRTCMRERDLARAERDATKTLGVLERTPRRNTNAPGMPPRPLNAEPEQISSSRVIGTQNLKFGVIFIIFNCFKA